ncbi:hypothetical protein FNW02_33850 [Komarekiella sp. 'clone 1']|uniref:Uncharacterized protein n=1 Tax=Komarekiella delphini-convector SJRDD-AB1 TaxID=2593771 RepID=A0AA40VUV5_9NOST|nr:hypothetical protein [Komarekiella delphini-convector]MBD6620622.1 hypothetical protein [Komarekiella delphini-convector SJRDD-AB1]
MFLNYLFAQSNGQQPGENTGTTIAPEILESVNKGSEMMINSFKQDWSSFANGQAPVYTAVVATSTMVAVVLISWWGLGWYSKFSEEGFSPDVISETIYPLLVILMLTNNGAMLASTCLALRNTTVTLNRSILSITKNGVTMKDAIRMVNSDQSFVLATQTMLAECDKLAGIKKDENGNIINKKEQCKKEAIELSRQEAIKAREAKKLGSGSGSWNPWDIGAETINNVVQGVVFIILNGMEAAFQYILQLSFLLTAYVSPIFLVLSLLPVSSKAIYAWLSGWLALTLILISYSIIVGIAASAIVDAPSTNPLLHQLIQAIFSPLLALAIGTGGGLSVFSAITGSSKFVLGKR